MLLVSSTCRSGNRDHIQATLVKVRDLEGQLWIVYNRGTGGGLARERSVEGLRARKALLDAMVAQMEAINPLVPGATTVPAPDREMEEMYAMIEAVNRRIGDNDIFFTDTALCEPPDADFQAWLASIDDL